MTNSDRERVGVAVVVAVCSLIMLGTMGRAVAGLVIALVVSYALFLRWPPRNLRRALPAYLLALVALGVHFLEEYRAGFHRVFPPILGAPPWTAATFVSFNVAWLVIFLLAIPGLFHRWHPMLLVALFLAIGAGVLNGLAHFALVLWTMAYFPGAYTAPLVLVTGTYLLIRLLRSVATNDHAI